MVCKQSSWLEIALLSFEYTEYFWAITSRYCIYKLMPASCWTFSNNQSKLSIFRNKSINQGSTAFKLFFFWNQQKTWLCDKARKDLIKKWYEHWKFMDTEQQSFLYLSQISANCKLVLNMLQKHLVL